MRKRNQKGLWTTVIVIGLLLLVAACSPATTPEAEQPSAPEPTTPAEVEQKGLIRLAEFNWTGSWIDNDLAAIVLEEHMGYEVEKVVVDYTAMWTALSTGDLHVAMEIWPSTAVAPIAEYIEEGSVVKVKDMGLVGQIGWYVPTFVIEGDPDRGIEPMAPDLETWEDLDKYADLFATRETEPKGRYLGGVVEWGNHEDERMETLGLNYEVVYAGSEAALNAELISANEQGEPVLLFHWVPHWIHAQVPTTRIPLPEYTDECYQTDFGCDFPKDELFIAAWSGLEEEYPEVYQFMENFQLANEDQNQMMLWIDGPEFQMDREEAARKWMEMPENEEKWKAWIP